GVPAVAEHDHHRAAVDQPTPIGEEGREALADARAPRPAVRVQLAQRLGVAVAAQRFGDAAQVGGKHGALHPRHRALQRVEESQALKSFSALPGRSLAPGTSSGSSAPSLSEDQPPSDGALAPGSLGGRRVITLPCEAGDCTTVPKNWKKTSSKTGKSSGRDASTHRKAKKTRSRRSTPIACSARTASVP